MYSIVSSRQFTLGKTFVSSFLRYHRTIFILLQTIMYFALRQVSRWNALCQPHVVRGKKEHMPVRHHPLAIHLIDDRLPMPAADLTRSLNIGG